MKDDDDEENRESLINSKCEANDHRMKDDTEFEDNDGDDLRKRRRILSVGRVKLHVGLSFGIATLGRLGFSCSCGREILHAFWPMRRIALPVPMPMPVSVVVCTEVREFCGTPSEGDELGEEEEEDGNHRNGGGPGLQRLEVPWCKGSSREWKVNEEILTYTVHTPLRHGEWSASKPGERRWMNAVAILDTELSGLLRGNTRSTTYNDT